MALHTLPTELLMIIIGHYPRLPLNVGGCLPMQGQQYLVRHRTIYALSQTSSRLRSVFLPLVWQSVEVFCPTVRGADGQMKGARWKKDMATELVRQLEIVTIRDPTLAEYVQSVTVYLTEYSWKGVFPEFCRALATMPNLKALHIVDVIDTRGKNESQRLVEAFKKHPPLSSVRYLSIPDKISGIIPHMPNVLRVYLSDSEYPRQSGNVLAHMRHAPWLKYTSYQFEIDRKDEWLNIVEHWPHLEHLNLIIRRKNEYQSGSSRDDNVIRQNLVTIVSGLPRLRSISIRNVREWMTYSTEEFQNDCEKLVLPTLAYALQKCLPTPKPEASVVSSTVPSPPRRLYPSGASVQRAARISMALDTVPTELLMIIVDHYPRLPLNFGGSLPTDGERFLIRHRTIYALSQTSSRLRSVFLPLVWQSVEVFCPTSRRGETQMKGTRWKKEMATELVRQLEIVTIRDPTLAEYVQSATVYLTEYSWQGVFPEFCRALCAMPKLKTLHIVDVVDTRSKNESQHLVAAFKKHPPLPSVRNLSIPEKISGVIPCMPNIKSLRLSGSSFPRPSKDVFAHMRRVSGLTYTSYKMEITWKNWPDLVQNWPNLEHLNLTIERQETYSFSPKRDDDAIRVSDFAISPENLNTIVSRLPCLKSILILNVSDRQDCENLIIPALKSALQKCCPKPIDEAEGVSRSATPPPRRLYVAYYTSREGRWSIVLAQKVKVVE
ncbi:hypothetical protein FB107DRAFT_289882 [Schizophyllum commune]